MLDFLPHQVLTVFPPTLTPEVHISAGQSWRVNPGLGMNDVNANPQTQTLLTLMVVGNPSFPSQVLPLLGTPANLAARFIGLTRAMQTSYPPPASTVDTGNCLDIGRAAICTQQMLRVQAGSKMLTPVINFNQAWPGSTWLSGSGGGLSNNVCTFTGSIAGSTLTVSSVAANTLIPGAIVMRNGVPILTDGTSSFPNVNLTISSQNSGTTGGVGSYALNGNQTVGAGTAMTTLGTAWYELQVYSGLVNAALPNASLGLTAPVYKSVGWTQGGSFDTSHAQATVDEWTAMEAAYDGMNFPGTGPASLLFYLGIRAPITTDVVCSQAIAGGIQFVRANANGRTIGTTPWYQWKFNGSDNIHTGPYGTVRHGECEGLARYITEDEGTQYKPLWRSLTPIMRGSQTLTVPFDRPTGSFFASAQMQWMSNPDDGIKVWPQNGWHVQRGGVDLTVTPTISGMNVVLAIAETLTPGDNLEVSYAWHGPGGPNPGTDPGCGGNLMMPGPPSVLFPNGYNGTSKTINSWAWPFVENITVQ
jgi:hypothetical protein